jgi:glycosyltransferase involved in cell wall biosynthesis
LRLLLITAWYHPFIHPRAHRWTSIAEYWATQGHEVHVVCARRRDCPDTAEVNGVQVHRAGFDSLKEVAYFLSGSSAGRGRVGAAVRQPGRIERMAMWLYRTFWKNIYFPDDACLWYFPARRKVRALLAAQPFDAVVSVSLPFTGHLVGRYVKQCMPAIHWLADIGDPFSIQAEPLNNAFLYARISRRLERTVLENADAVVVTNSGAVRAYRQVFGDLAARLAVVPPVWNEPQSRLWQHREFAHQTEQMGTDNHSSCIIHHASFQIGYFGALYAPVRTPNAFLDLLDKTIAARPELLGRLQVHFFGEVFPEFFQKLHRAPGVQLHGLRARAEVQAAMRQMDVLVNIGNTTEYQLPSKVVDYLAAGKPVLHLSYVEHDPFLDFWGDTPGLLTLRVRHDRVADEDILRWLAFLEEKHTIPTAAECLQRVQTFTVAAVATAYEEFLFPKKNHGATPGTAAAPRHRQIPEAPFGG